MNLGLVSEPSLHKLDSARLSSFVSMFIDFLQVSQYWVGKFSLIAMLDNSFFPVQMRKFGNFVKFFTYGWASITLLIC